MQLAKEREIYWIKYYAAYENRENYNETPGGDIPGTNTIHIGEKHGMAKLTKQDVIFCREQYKLGARSRDIHNQYFKDKINYGGFLRMWHGQTWKHIMPEAFLHNPHRAKYNATDRDIIVKMFKESQMSMQQFVKTEQCYVGYGTLWKMVNTPEVYN